MRGSCVPHRIGGRLGQFERLEQPVPDLCPDFRETRQNEDRLAAHHRFAGRG